VSDLHLQTFPVFNFFFFSPFLFSSFLIFLLQWSTFYWACFQFKKSRESIFKMGKSYHRKAKCSQINFALSFSGPVDPITLICINLNSSIDDANFGQSWCHQKWNKGQCLSLPVTAGMGINGLINYLTDWLTDWLTDCLSVCLSVCKFVWMVGWLTDWLWGRDLQLRWKQSG